MSHFEEKYDDFLADANVLRRRFSPDSEREGASLLGPRSSTAALVLLHQTRLPAFAT